MSIITFTHILVKKLWMYPLFPSQTFLCTIYCKLELKFILNSKALQLGGRNNNMLKLQLRISHLMFRNYLWSHYDASFIC